MLRLPDPGVVLRARHHITGHTEIHPRLPLSIRVRGPWQSPAQYIRTVCC